MPLEAKLVLRGTPERKDAAEWLLQARTTIGRAPGNGVILGDREVSKQHAMVLLQQGEWLVRDLGSANGTFVNGRKISEHRLRHGDELVVGTTRLVFQLRAVKAEEQPIHTPLGDIPEDTVTMVSTAPDLIASTPVEEERSFVPATQVSDVEVLRRDYEKLRLAHDFHRALGAADSPKAVCEKVLEVAVAMLPAADSGVVLRREGESTLKVVAVKTPRGMGGVLLSETLLERVVKGRQGILTNDAMLDSRFRGAQSIVSRGVRSAMAVPLLGTLRDGGVRGVLFLDTRVQTGAFSEKDLRLLTAIGTQAGIALENAELAQARAQLARYLPPPLVEQAARGDIALGEAGAQLEGTILFADLRNFTATAERVGAAETVALLNRFFAAMVDEVFAMGGVLDKFLGDGLMALFGLPVRQDDAGATAALRCALQMQRRMAVLSQERAASGREPLEMGVGVNTGPVIVGSMGSERRLEYTAVGDPVNVAARLCSIAQGGQIICGEHTAERSRGAFSLRALAPQRVKGKVEPIAIYQVEGSAD
jgi:adenylate cyclase